MAANVRAASKNIELLKGKILGATAFSITTLNITILSMTILNITTLSMTILNIMTLNITTFSITIRKCVTQHNGN
jgi:hypothetical protein